MKEILLDLDGTILGNRNIPLQIDFIMRAVRSFRPHGGIAKAWKAIRAMREELAKAPAGHPEGPTNDKRAASAFARALGLDPENAEKTLHTSLTGLFPSLKWHFFPIREATAFLDWAKERYSLILATDPVWPLELVILRLEWAGVDPGIFRKITHAQIMHACKPTAEYYREVLSTADLKASETMLIGNDMQMDLPASRVGIPVYIISKNPRIMPLPTESGSAQAWSGSFEALRKALEKSPAGLHSL